MAPSKVLYPKGSSNSEVIASMLPAKRFEGPLVVIETTPPVRSPYSAEIPPVIVLISAIIP